MKARTKAVEHDLCAAIDHVLLHRSRTSHSCKCGYRTVWGPLESGVIESGDCPECDEARDLERIENINMQRLEQIEEAVEKERFERDFRVKLVLLQTAAMLRATCEFSIKEAVDEASKLLAEINKRF